jgi:hypothetical protein
MESPDTREKKKLKRRQREAGSELVVPDRQCRGQDAQHQERLRARLHIKTPESSEIMPPKIPPKICSFVRDLSQQPCSTNPTHAPGT